MASETPSNPQSSEPVVKPLGDEVVVYELLDELAKTYGYQLPDREALSRRGIVFFEKDKKLKQGGLTLANDLIADIARHAVRTGQVKTPEEAAKFLETAKSLEAAIPTIRLRRGIQSAIREEKAGFKLPRTGLVEREGKYVRPSALYDESAEVSKRFSEDIRSATGRRIAVQTPEGKLVPLKLTEADFAEIQSIAKERPDLSGFYQNTTKTKPSGEPFDPLVNLELFGRAQRINVFRKILNRLQKSGLYPKGSKIVELDEAKEGKTVSVERTRDPRFVPPSEGAAGKKQKARFGEAFKEGYEKSVENRDEYGRIRQGSPTIGRTPQLREPARPAQYDLPNEVDLVMEEGRMLFSYPGAAKPGPLQDVVNYYKSQATANPNDPDAVSNYTKMLKTSRAVKYISNDPNAINVALDRAAREKQTESQEISQFDEEAQSSRRAFKAALREELAPRDRGSAQRRRAAEEASMAQAGLPGRGPKLYTSRQWTKLKKTEESLREFLQSRGVSPKDIEARIDQLTKPLETAGFAPVAKDAPAVPGVSEPETRFYLQDFPHKGSQARLMGRKGRGNLARQMYGIRSAISETIRNLQDAEVAARLDAGETRQQILEAGGPTTYRRQGARPFDASKTKDLIPSPFASKKSEQGILTAAEAELGTKTRMEVEDIVKRIIDRSKHKPSEERRSVIEANLLSEMDRASKRGIEPSTFMKAARAANPLIQDIMTEEISQASKERHGRLSSEAIDRIERGDVPETVSRLAPGHIFEANIDAAIESRNRRNFALRALASLIPQIESALVAKRTGRPDALRLGPEVPVVPESGVVLTPAVKRRIAATKRERMVADRAKMDRIAAALRELENPHSLLRRRSRQKVREDLLLERVGPQVEAMLRETLLRHLERMKITSPIRIPKKSYPPREGMPQPFVGGLEAAEPGVYVPPGGPQRPSVLTPAQQAELRALAARLSAARGRGAGRKVLARYGLK